MIHHRVTTRLAEAELSRTWFFRLAGFAFASLTVPLLATSLRGLLGFSALIYVSVLAGLADKSLTRVVRAIQAGISSNKWLVFFALWYVAGASLNILLRGQGVPDWRLTVGPAVLLIALCFAFSFARENAGHRWFQIGLGLALGVQSIFTIRELSGVNEIAREMWTELEGAWAFGNQTAYATWVMLLPVLIWRALAERGALRLLLLAAAALTGVAAAISSFATPLALLAIGAAAIVVLRLLLSVRGQARWKGALLAGCVVIAGVLLFQYTRNNALFAASYGRIENLVLDPQGGGYAGEARASSRWYLAQISIESLLSRPLFGMGGGSLRASSYVGGHSSVLDSLGAFGLLGGGGAFVGLLITVLSAAASKFFKQRSWETLLALASVILLLVSGVINPYGDGLALYMVLIMARPFALLAQTTGVVRPEGPRALSRNTNTVP